MIRPVPTILVGAFGGALVGITSVGSGSVIMVALLMLHPTLSAIRLVGTDLVQAVPLALSAAIANIIATGGWRNPLFRRTATAEGSGDNSGASTRV